MVSSAPAQKALPQGIKLAIDLGPLVLFLIAYRFADIFVATLVLMVASAVAMATAYALIRRVPAMLIVTTVVVLVFGGLTIWLHDEQFIKLKPTIIYTLFAAALLGGLAFGKPLLGEVLDWAFRIDDAGWRKLTLRWGLFFLVMAGVNEFVWRSFDTSTWVSFKLFGFTGLTLLFALSQVPLIQKHTIEDEAAPTES